MAMESSMNEESNQRSENRGTYEWPYPIYAMAFSTWGRARPRIAVGSFIEEYNNKVEVLGIDAESMAMAPHPGLCFDHPYPPTKLMFNPKPPSIFNNSAELLASSGDYLRLWEVAESSIQPLSLLNNSKTSEFCAPLTSFDWNEADPSLIATSSIDTTCTVWDLDRCLVHTQLIAHDKEVYDIAWGEAKVFASVSGDGSVRMFDLRNKEHSTIIYESPVAETPLLRVAWNKCDPRYMATILMDSNKIVILDIRSPTLPVAELERHRASVNAVAWAPHGCRQLCSGADDTQALIWDLPATLAPPPSQGIDPLSVYSAPSEINQLQWSPLHPHWIAIAFSSNLQLLTL